MATVTLTIVRHGQTKANLNGIVQSRTGGELTVQGIIMAESLGKYLQEEKFNSAYSSDLHRCQQTSQYILENIKSPPKLILEEILRERDFGDLEHFPCKEVEECMKKSGLPFYSTPIPGGEPFEDVKKRCAKFFNTICKIADKAESDENILAITHGGWILCFFEYLFSNQSSFQLENINETEALSRVENTARTKMRITQLPPNSLNKRRIEFFAVNDISHLDFIN